MFLANYSDGLTDLPLTDMVDHFRKQGAIGSFLCSLPPLSYHFVSLGSEGEVKAITDIKGSGLRINCGYFVFRREIFDYMREGEELVLQPFDRLLEARRLVAYKYDGFWRGMDTFKDKQALDEMYSRGNAPWEMWKRAPGPAR